MIWKVEKAGCPNYRWGYCEFSKIAGEKKNVSSPLSRRGAGGEAFLKHD